MKKQITISVPEEQAEALACFLHKKDTTIEQEMEYAVTRLYEKHVPPTVRDFLETKATLEEARDGQPHQGPDHQRSLHLPHLAFADGDDR